MDPYPFELAFRARAQTHLDRFERRPLHAPDLKPAAVALVLVPDDEGRCCVVLTRRAAGLRTHAGQYALPGGRRDDREQAAETALRELQEEVGLEARAGAVLGVLDDYATRSGFVITPVVVWGAEGTLRPNPEEVAQAYRVPLSALDEPGIPRITHISESDRPVLSIPLVGTFVHAPTAAILYQLREVVLHGRSVRVAHFEQPRFAWR